MNGAEMTNSSRELEDNSEKSLNFGKLQIKNVEDFIRELDERLQCLRELRSQTYLSENISETVLAYDSAIHKLCDLRSVAVEYKQRGLNLEELARRIAKEVQL